MLCFSSYYILGPIPGGLVVGSCTGKSSEGPELWMEFLPL